MNKEEHKPVKKEEHKPVLKDAPVEEPKSKKPEAFAGDKVFTECFARLIDRLRAFRDQSDGLTAAGQKALGELEAVVRELYNYTTGQVDPING